MKYVSLLNSIILVFMLSCVSAQAQPGKRIALLIGNKDYSRAVGSLDNPHKDIELLAGTLRGLGFKVMPLVKDASRAAILEAIYGYTQALKLARPFHKLCHLSFSDSLFGKWISS